MPRTRIALGIVSVALSCLGTLFSPVPAGAAALSAFEPLDLDRGATGLALALRKLGATGRVLYVTAHPDDEHNGVLVRLSRGLGLRTALLTVTRGEGGQNVIGPELFEALGVLRTGELLALHRYDGVEQYFGRAYEFGYSFSVEETFAKWGHDETLGDVVRVVRAFRPDVILTLPLEGTGGGQHHQAVARLAREAFRAAADPGRFPEQLAEGLRPWQARKIYQGGVGGFGRIPGELVHVPTGVYDPLLGMTWQQFGRRARTMHRCQGEPQLGIDPAPAEGSYSLIDAEPRVAGAEGDILDGIDTSLAGLARFAPDSPSLAVELAATQQTIAAARTALDPGSPAKAAPGLAAALSSLRALESGLAARLSDPVARAEVAERLQDEEADGEAALALAYGLAFEARADDGLVTPGQSFTVDAALFDSSGVGIKLDALELDAPAGWSVERRAVEAGTERDPAQRARFAVTVAADARPTQPYWRRARDRDRNELRFATDPTLPFAPPALVARARGRIGGIALTLRTPVVWRYPGPAVGGERRHALSVVPALSLRMSPEITAVPLAGPRRPIEVRVFARSLEPGARQATLRLAVPPGWTVEPPSAQLGFSYEGEEAGGRFHVTPPAALGAGTFALAAVASEAGREYRETVQAVEYDHVERRQLLRPAETRVLALDVRTAAAASVGYVAGSGDALADAVEQLGVPLTRLTADDLAFSDLSRFSTILTGIRAYEVRPDLRAAHGRLMRWVAAGGHLVVQYNRTAFNVLVPEAARPAVEASSSPYAPFPAAVSSERISDETAPLRVLVPAHPLLNVPNRIGAADWDGLVQERGIQFLVARDPRYTELLAASDPFPGNAGEKHGILVDAAVGKGTWTYVGLALFRQVPAGVPGGWRLLANLVSRPRAAR